MGFGYLFIGYLITFVIYMTVNSLGFGGLALLIGYGVMFLGLWHLCLYNHVFIYAKWLQIPLLVTAVYDLFRSLDTLFLWNLGFFGETVKGIFEWITFILLITFNVAMLYGIRVLARDVGLSHISVKAVRNTVFVFLYAFLSLISKLPFLQTEAIQQYLTLPIILVDLVWIVLNLLLLISCAKNICPAGDEDMPAKRSRFEWINRVGDTYERNRQKAIDDTRREAEEALRRRQEKRNAKPNKKKK